MSKTKQLIAELIEMVRLARHHGHCQDPLKVKLTAGLEALDKHIDSVTPPQATPEEEATLNDSIASNAAPTPPTTPSTPPTPPVVSEIDPPAPATPPIVTDPIPEAPATPPAEPEAVPEVPATPESVTPESVNPVPDPAPAAS